MYRFFGIGAAPVLQGDERSLFSRFIEDVEAGVGRSLLQELIGTADGDGQVAAHGLLQVMDGPPRFFQKDIHDIVRCLVVSQQVQGGSYALGQGHVVPFLAVPQIDPGRRRRLFTIAAVGQFPAAFGRRDEVGQDADGIHAFIIAADVDWFALDQDDGQDFADRTGVSHEFPLFFMVRFAVDEDIVSQAIRRAQFIEQGNSRPHAGRIRFFIRQG